MAGTLSVQKIQGLASSSTPTVVEVSSGHSIKGGESHFDTLKGKTAAGTINVQGEGSATTNLQQGLCKAWCFLDGYNALITDSFNITHETDEGTGAHQVNITSPMANATFAIANNRSRSADGRVAYDEMTCNDKATNGFSLNTAQSANNAAQDNSVLDAIVMGDLA